MKKILLLYVLALIPKVIEAQNDSLYFWKNGQLLAMRSIKEADLDSITFNRPAPIAGPNITDIDGNSYQSVARCNLIFTKQNLNVSKYTDGTPIPQVQSQTEWASMTTGAWCYYNNDPASGEIYGKLYNWYAVAGIYDAASAANPALRKKLAPIGWHIPSRSEWWQLISCLGGNHPAGGKMKATGTIEGQTGLWRAPNTNASNESGFTGLPGSYRRNDWGFNLIGSGGWWWASTLNENNYPHRVLLSHQTGYAYLDYSYWGYGLSVRCFKD